MEFKEVFKVNDLIESVSETYSLSADEVVLINTSDILSGKVLNHQKVNNINLKGQFKKSFKKDDILYSEIRPKNSRYAYIDFEPIDYIASTKLMVLRRKNPKALQKYIYYFLTSNNTLEKLQMLAESRSGTFPQITFNELGSLEMQVPTLNEQINIANFLDNLNLKIEVNNAIVANLEAQAQAIFKSWFIDFEPFQDGEFVERELGMIPEGWEVGKLGNSTLGKLISSGISNFENEKVYLATSDVTDSNITNYQNKVTFEDRPSRANMQPLKNSVWFAKMKESRKLIYVGNNNNFLINETIFSTGFAGIESNEIGINYLWTYLLTEDFDNKKNLLSNGTTMQAINNANINRIKILIPEEEVLEKFNELVKPMYEIISIYKNQNITLAQLRDTLLPKLMSGEIRVGRESTETLENIEEIDVKENL